MSGKADSRTRTSVRPAPYVATDASRAAARPRLERPGRRARRLAGLTARAAEIAARQRSPETRRTYAAVYRGFGAFLGPDATANHLTAEAVRAYRDALKRAGRSPATLPKHLSALRGLAEELGVDAQLRTVRSARVGRGEPRALSHDEWARLLRMPDRRARHGKRDLALERAALYPTAPIAVTPEVGEFLYVLAAASGARRIIEFGASLGGGGRARRWR